MHPETIKGRNWERFAEDVLIHVETYTVPQYGDTGRDRVDGYSIHDCKMAIERYLARIGRNSRPGQDKRDMMKIAHYANFIYDKIEETITMEKGLIAVPLKGELNNAN